MLIASDEAMLDAMCTALATSGDGMPPRVREEFRHAIRSHRIRILKQRARLGAKDIDV